MNTEALKLAIENAIATRDFRCNSKCELGILVSKIIVVPLRYQAPGWHPCCKLTKTEMDEGMTAKQWDLITNKLSLLMEGLPI